MSDLRGRYLHWDAGRVAQWGGQSSVPDSSWRDYGSLRRYSSVLIIYSWRLPPPTFFIVDERLCKPSYTDVEIRIRFQVEIRGWKAEDYRYMTEVIGGAWHRLNSLWVHGESDPFPLKNLSWWVIIPNLFL